MKVGGDTNPERERQLSVALRMWSEGLMHRDDLSLFVEELSVENRDPQIVRAVPQEIRDVILEDAARALAGQAQMLILLESGEKIDISAMRLQLAKLLLEAGLLGAPHLPSA